MNDGSSIELCDCRCKNLRGECGCCDERSVDEIFAAVEQGLSVLDAAQLAAVSAMTGISIEKLIELGGVNDDA